MGHLMGYGHVLGLLAAVLEIALIDLLLSGDNALVIALACRGLPRQVRRQVVWLGTVAGVVLRIVLTAGAALVLNARFLKLIGAVLLAAIAVKLSAPDASLERDDSGRQHNLWNALVTILVADTVMSADNILAVAAASQGSYLLLSLGLLVSVPILIFGSLFVSHALDRYPLLVPVGGALLGWVAGDMAVSDPAVKGWLDAQPFVQSLARSIDLPVAASLIGAACVLAIAHWSGPGKRRPIR